MDNIISWIAQNILSITGILVTLIGGLLFKKWRNHSSQTIRTGNNSISIQSGRDIKLGSINKRDDVEKN